MTNGGYVSVGQKGMRMMSNWLITTRGNTMTKIDPIHPGEHLAEFIEEYDISQYRIAKDIHVPPRRINEIVKGQRGITADTAIRLGRYFGTSPQFWTNLQSNYEIEIAAAKMDEDIQPLVAA